MQLLDINYTQNLDAYKSINDYIPNNMESTQNVNTLENLKVKLIPRNQTGVLHVNLNNSSNNMEYKSRKTFVNVPIQAFEYFKTEELPTPDLFALPDGTIFRIASGNVKSKNSYTYYIMKNGYKLQIPNYRSVEVLLYERNQNHLAVRIVEENQGLEIPDGGVYADMSLQWNSNMADESGIN